MSAQEAAQGIIQAIQEDEYEAGLGSAARLRELREKLFSDLNG